MFEQWKARRAQRAAALAAQAREAQIAQSRAVEQQLNALIRLATDAAAGTWPSIDTSMPLRRDEHALVELDGAGLVESRRGPGHWQGGSQAVSVHVPGTKSMRYRVGGTRGTYVQGDENPTIIDTGTLTITNQRAVFVGSTQTREWAWPKLVGFHDDHVADWTGIAVSNRQKVSGVSYPADQAAPIRFSLELGAALTNGTVTDFIHDLQTERASLATQTAEPDGTGPATRPAVDPGTSSTPDTDSA